MHAEKTFLGSNLALVNNLANDDWYWSDAPLSPDDADTFRYVLSCLDMQPDALEAIAQDGERVLQMEWRADYGNDYILYTLTPSRVDEIVCIGDMMRTTRSWNIRDHGVNGIVAAINDGVHELFGE